MYARADKRSTLARRDSALVIEGFPRSGNTFSVAAFQIANGPSRTWAATSTGHRTCCARSDSGSPPSR